MNNNNRQGNALINEAVHNNSNSKKYCRFKKYGIKYVDYKDPEFLKGFLNNQGKILPRHLTGTSLKYQKRVTVAIKRARHLAILPFVTDGLREE